MKKALVMASVASMIDLFNMENIKILRDLGFDVHVACNFKFGSITSQKRVNEFRVELESSGIKTFQLPVPRRISAFSDIIKSFKLMRQLCQDNSYQIVHCHSPIGGVIARFACKNQRKNGTKIIYTAHGFHFFKGASIKNWMIYYPVEKFLAKYTDILITMNEEDYKTANKFKSTTVKYVPGIGVDTDEIKNVKVDRVSKRLEFGIKYNDFILLSVGQLSKRKNHKVIVNALSKITDEKVKLLICGLGELENYLSDLVKQLNLEERVVFAGYRNDIKELLYIADCFVFPSLQEGLPVALMEAMSAGLPVVCSKIRGNTDLIENGKGGFLVDSQDVGGFAKALSDIINDKKISKQMSAYNLTEINKFDSKSVNKIMKQIYVDIDKKIEF